MIFDGGEVKNYDSVYDVAYGSGRVVEINEGSGIFRVAFGPRTFAYNTKGFGTFQRKTLFWRDPISNFVPMKDDATWDKFNTIRNSTALALGRL